MKKLKFAKPRHKAVTMSTRQVSKSGRYLRTRQIKRSRRVASRKSLKNQCDKLFSEVIRSKGSCEMCLRTPPNVVLECAHVISRSNLHLRYDPLNTLVLCRGCHYRWHREPLWAVTWFQGVYKDRYEYLMRERNVIEPKMDYEFILGGLKYALSKKA